MKQCFFSVACWSACTPVQLSGTHCGMVSLYLHSLCCRQRLTRYTQRRLCVTEASGKLDHWLMLCCKHEPHCCFSCLPYSSSRHCFQHGHFTGPSTCVNGLFFCLTRQNFHFWQGRPFTRVAQMLPACQTLWVTLAYMWGPPVLCVQQEHLHQENTSSSS